MDYETMKIRWIACK